MHNISVCSVATTPASTDWIHSRCAPMSLYPCTLCPAYVHKWFRRRRSPSARSPAPPGSINTRSWSAVSLQRAVPLLTTKPASVLPAALAPSWTPACVVTRRIRDVALASNVGWRLQALTEQLDTCHTAACCGLWRADPACSCTPGWRVFSGCCSSPPPYPSHSYRCGP